MEHPSVIRLGEHATWRSEGMGKSTVFESPRLMVGLNAFEPGQSHTLHAHADMDKVYQVVEGEGGLGGGHGVLLRVVGFGGRSMTACEGSVATHRLTK